MSKVKAFVGHSFDENDEQIVRKFLDYFDTLSEMGFEWDSAEEAEPKTLSEKVKKKMDGKNLFIGIFTAKTMQVCPSKLKENTFFKKDCYSVSKADFKRCTSEWIIQESGYAMGKGMNLIFLIEDVLNTVGGLQGDLGFIRFSRNNPELCFSEINEMISSLVKQQAKTGGEVIEKSKPQEVTETEKTIEETPDELKEKKTKNIIEELLSAIKRGDEEKEVELYGKKLKECEGDKNKEISFKSFYYAMRHTINGVDELENLSKLSYENPEYSKPHYWRGVLLENYHDYEKAYDEFSQAAIKSKDDIDKTANLCKASTALIKAKKYTQAREIILKRFQGINKNSTRENVELLKTLAKIELAEGKTDRYFSFCENALKLNPSDADLRFELASTYSKYDKHSSSLHHYKILSENVPNSANWNNLGVELSEFELAGKSVDAYLKSKELGGTTAMGNLAYKLIDIGFYGEAKKYIQEALKHDNCSSNVSSSLSSLESKKYGEDDKEQELLLDVPSRIMFRVKYAEAYTRITEMPSLQGRWKTKHGDVHVAITERQFTATGKFEQPKIGLAAVLGMVKPETITINYEGVINNGVIDYQLSVTTRPSGNIDRSPKTGSLLGGALIDSNALTVKYNGQMVISEDFKKIEAMESDNKGNVSFYDITPLGTV
jgi:tetratricopeptide (TPR) repeat protein